MICLYRDKFFSSRNKIHPRCKEVFLGKVFHTQIRWKYTIFLLPKLLLVLNTKIDVLRNGVKTKVEVSNFFSCSKKGNTHKQDKKLCYFWQFLKKKLKILYRKQPIWAFRKILFSNRQFENLSIANQPSSLDGIVETVWWVDRNRNILFC